MKRIFWFSIAVALAGGAVFPLRAEEGESSPPPPPKIHFPETEYDAGEVWEGEKVSRVFTFTNVGGSVLEIGRIVTTCRCAAGVVSEKLVAPGESGAIQASFDTRGYRGRRNQPVVVHSNDPGNPAARLQIWATIRTVGAFSPPSLEFARVPQGRGLVGEISLVFAGDPVPIREISAEPGIFSARLLEPEDPGKASPVRIEVTLSPDAPVGRHRGTLAVRFDHPRAPGLTANLGAVVDGTIRHSPRLLFFNESDQSGRIVHEIRVVNQTGDPVTIRKAESSIPQFEVAEVRTIEPGNEFAVGVRLRPGAEPGRYSGEIRIETDHPEGIAITVPLRSRFIRRPPGD